MKEEKGKNFSKDVKMHLACLKEDVTNPTLGCIYIKNGYAYASDRSILVRNDLRDMSNFDDADIEALDGKYIPADFYKEIIKYDDCLISDEGIECHKDDDKAFFYFNDFGDSKYPNADQVLENALNKMTVPMPQIGFDVKKNANTLQGSIWSQPMQSHVQRRGATYCVLQLGEKFKQRRASDARNDKRRLSNDRTRLHPRLVDTAP